MLPEVGFGHAFSYERFKLMDRLPLRIHGNGETMDVFNILPALHRDWQEHHHGP